MKNGTILHEISTHKAVVQGSEIVIFEIGMIVDGEICTEETRRTFPEWFEDKELWRIPLDQRDDRYICIIS